MLRKRWRLPAPAEPALALSQALGIARPVAAILCARGYATPEAARAFLNPELDGLLNPFLLRDLGKALDRLKLAIARGEKIEIHGDYDVDGATSTVVLKRAIELAGGQAGFRIPHRLKEGYGMHRDTIDQAAANGVGLIISVDTGIRAAAMVEHARALGIDVIITDHHLPEEALPDAVAVVNPNRPDCTYPNKNLCGAGVAFKLVHALLASLGWPKEKLERILESFLKLVAIGTVADVVPLTGENRIIVRHGLRGLTQVRNPGLQALLEVAGFRQGIPPTAGQVGFRLAPRINAAGRMDTAVQAVELFLTNDQERARAIAASLHELNAERQAEEARIVEEILAACEAAPVDDNQWALVFSSADWHRGVLGIVASRLVERFCRPVFVLSEDGDGRARGSGRSIEGFHLLDALDSMREVFVQYGGHSHAAGLTMETAQVADFRLRFNAFAAGCLTPEHRLPVQRIDAVVDLEDLNDGLWGDLSLLEPFGMGNPAPVLALLDVEVASKSFMKEKHIRLSLRREKRWIQAKGFHMAEATGDIGPGDRVDCALALEADHFNGGWACLLRDVRRA